MQKNIIYKIYIDMRYIKLFENKDSGIFDIIKNIEIGNNNNYDIEFTKKLIEKEIKDGVDLNIKDKYNRTVLLYSTRYSEICKLLIDAGSDVDAQDVYNNTALILSAYHHHRFETLKLLIEAGADWNLKNDDNDDFLSYLNMYKKNKIIKLYPEQYEEYLIKKRFNDSVEKYNL